MDGIGNKIKELRVKNNLSGEELGDKIGVTKAMISYYETNKTTPTIDVLEKIASILGVDIHYFIGEKEDSKYKQRYLEIKKKYEEADAERLDLLRKLVKIQSELNKGKA